MLWNNTRSLDQVSVCVYVYIRKHNRILEGKVIVKVTVWLLYNQQFQGAWHKTRVEVGTHFAQEGITKYRESGGEGI